jgi:hypothetical protein
MALAAFSLALAVCLADVPGDPPTWDRQDNVKYDDKHETQRVGWQRDSSLGTDETVSECQHTCIALGVDRCQGFAFDGACHYYKTAQADVTVVDELGSSVFLLTKTPLTKVPLVTPSGNVRFHKYALLYKTGHLGNEMTGYWKLRARVRVNACPFLETLHRPRALLKTLQDDMIGRSFQMPTWSNRELNSSLLGFLPVLVAPDEGITHVTEQQAKQMQVLNSLVSLVTHPPPHANPAICR